jgi:hypothetical protein
MVCLLMPSRNGCMPVVSETHVFFIGLSIE